LRFSPLKVAGAGAGRGADAAAPPSAGTADASISFTGVLRAVLVLDMGAILKKVMGYQLAT
jgi:hypothetical protein